MNSLPQSSRNGDRPTPPPIEYLIIGAGPAGLQLGYYLQKTGKNYLILEAGDAPGTFFKTFPRHRRLISVNKIFTGYADHELNLRWDWHSFLCDSEALRFRHYSKRYFPDADDLVRYCDDFARHYQLRIHFRRRVLNVARHKHFLVKDSTGETHAAKRLIVASGVSVPYLPPIPGIDLAEEYSTVSVAPETFANQKVLVIGKGNSGFETADNLIETAALIHIASPNPLRMAWRSHFVGHLRAVNNNFLDTYQLKSQNAVLDASIERVARNGAGYVVSVRYAHAHGESEELHYDRVIVCAGFRFDASIFDASCEPETTLNGRFPSQTSEWESTNVKDLYFAGTLMQTRDYKRSTSGFIHGFRYNMRALHHIFEEKYHGQPWPHRSLPGTAQALTDSVISRVNRTSALWQQFGFLCDVILVSSGSDQARWLEAMPIDYVHDTDLGRQKHYYVLTLEYGRNHDAADPFSVTRIARHDHQRSEESNFLHPVIRRYSGSALVAEHHIIEDLQAEWREPEHVEPLREFFELDLARSAEARMAYA